MYYLLFKKIYNCIIRLPFLTYVQYSEFEFSSTNIVQLTLVFEWVINQQLLDFKLGILSVFAGWFLTKFQFLWGLWLYKL